ncbi:hypothetical protein [Asticcacaulis sp. YBE204]|uniref:hypothetical protein n=1 Tax=Asticcacaulis sp. YBE204 TaxID=1282363 RepID=UPI0003C3D392|nr:hypothetical protein [Asticcacaulis sp. YBE204]ESQ80155.1 hypothetical protein AEYBE204_05925 [Asticcacaulis sp. YBE204]
MSDKPNLPVPAGPVVDHAIPRARRANKAYENADYAAQVLGGGEKRGLRGGPETLDRAKSTYLKSEYSGPNDRRPAPGRIKQEKI